MLCVRKQANSEALALPGHIGETPPMSKDVITDIDQLRSLYSTPHPRAANKVIDRIDPASRRFIARCPLVMLATASRAGRCDVSPRGGPPGFVVVLDERHVVLPDYAGNNRLDSARNIIETGHAGLLLCVPGKPETIRINGPAYLTTDPEILDRTDPKFRRPKMALVIETEELFAHCAQSFRRSGVWDPSTWNALGDTPDLAEIYSSQFGGSIRQYQEALAKAYEVGLAKDRPEDLPPTKPPTEKAQEGPSDKNHL